MPHKSVFASTKPHRAAIKGGVPAKSVAAKICCELLGYKAASNDPLSTSSSTHLLLELAFLHQSSALVKVAGASSCCCGAGSAARVADCIASRCVLCSLSCLAEAAIACWTSSCSARLLQHGMSDVPCSLMLWPRFDGLLCIPRCARDSVATSCCSPVSAPLIFLRRANLGMLSPYSRPRSRLHAVIPFDLVTNLVISHPVCRTIQGSSACFVG